MNREDYKKAIFAVRDIMVKNRDYLIELDARNGDGDLGISMSDGFNGAAVFLEASEETDLGKLIMGSSKAFNEAAPSSLGTILTIGMMGMAKALKGLTEASTEQVGSALVAGVENIMKKAGSKPGEKTIIDSIYPAAQALCKNASLGKKEALNEDYKAAKEGLAATKNMLAVHGRAAFYGEKSLGIEDGGAVVGKLIFEALYEAF